MKHLAGNSKQQVLADGNPYLRVYCILAGSVERLDVQMLFDPFEETFHLPTFPIKFSNGQVRMCEVIGQEPIDISRGIILIHNHAECIRIPSGGFQSRQPDSGIANNSGTFINRMFFYHLILHVVLGPGDEESPLAMKVAEQLLEIHMSLIHEVVIARLHGYEAHSFGVMDCSFRQINKCGNRSPQIQQGMHLYTTFIMMKSCPWTELQAKFHRTAVEGMDDSVHVESGRLVAVQVSRLCNQYLTEVVIDTPVLGPVDMCQSNPLRIELRNSTEKFNVSDIYIEKIIKYIEANFYLEFNINRLTDLVPLSRRSLEIRFKKTMGISIYQFILNVRMDHFIILLTTTKMSMCDLINQCGFSDYSNVFRMFKKIKGCSPIEYRQKFGE